ncbi:MAG: Omp28-related outer membrane protein [Bacteroidales bacterium]|nr:Omp28-related outer membrane protein [Bacteroidales bacterium]
MKHSSILSLFALSLLLSFASCDKIDEDKYVVFAGASGTWYDSEANISNVQRAFVEKYTGVRCVNCPNADVVLHAAAEKYGDQLVIAAVHVPNNFGKPLHGEQDLRTEKGSTWFNTFFSTSQNLPSALLNRAKADENSLDIIDPQVRFDDKIDAILATTPKIGIDISNAKDGDLYNAEVHVQFNQPINDPLTLTLLVVEDKLYTTQESMADGRINEIENYEQNHVLRDVLTDAWGIDIDADGNQGTKRMILLPFTLGQSWNPANCHLIAFVSNKATREIINVAQCDLQ